jgi:hypothetical protein
MKNILIIICLMATTLLTGCLGGSESESAINEPDKSKAYYMKNDVERAEKIKFCSESTKRKLLANCITANRAQEKLDRRKMMEG